MEVDKPAAPAASSSGLEFRLHPLVLINISDHHTRTRANQADPAAPPATVMGCLLGSQSGRSIDISNSFEMNYTAEADGGVTVDYPFLLKKQEQYKAVFPKLDVVGWYCTGAALEERHLQVHRKLSEQTESPALLLLDPAYKPGAKELPLSLYESEVHVSDGQPLIAFVKSAYTIETSDAERIGVDQVAKILPSGKASGSEQLAAHYASTHSAIKMLHERLRLLQQLLAQASSGTIPYPHDLLRQVASLVASLPALDGPAFQKDFLTEYNDTLLTIYLTTITKGILQTNEVVEKVALAYEKSSGKGDVGGSTGGGRRSGRMVGGIF